MLNHVDILYVEDKLYELIDQFNERKTYHRDFYFALLDNMHSFYDGNGRSCKILFAANFNYKKVV